MTNINLFKNTIPGLFFLIIGVVTIIIANKIKSISCLSDGNVNCMISTGIIVIISVPALMIGISAIILAFVDKNRKIDYRLQFSKYKNSRDVRLTTLLLIFVILALMFGEIFIRMVLSVV